MLNYYKNIILFTEQKVSRIVEKQNILTLYYNDIDKPLSDTGVDNYNTFEA